MSARKLGRFAAGVFLALGLAFGGVLLAGATDGGAAPAAADAIATQIDYEWG